MPASVTRHRRAAIALVAIAAIAMVILYWFHGRSGTVSGHAHAIATLPAPDVPVGHPTVQRSVPIKINPPNDDRVATGRIGSAMDAATIVNCHSALLQSRPVRGRENCDFIKPNDAIGMQLCQRALVSDAARIQQMTAEAASCPKSLAKASDYYNALRDAAQNGDVTAQQCFIRGYFEDAEGGDFISQEQTDEYMVLARSYISSGLERGDWGLVRRLSSVRLYVSDGLLFGAYPFGHSAPETMYKMNFLLTLGGATDAVVDRPQSIVKSLRTDGELSDRQIQAAEEWARDTYSKYFAAGPYNAKAAADSFCKYR
jgi:hypothetical protein